MNQRTACFRRGEFIQVLPFAEIRKTLDASCTFEGLPFMPEMLPFCERSFQIVNRADHVRSDYFGMRRLKNTVLLNAPRCDGSNHDQCNRGCTILWKTAWLRPIEILTRTAPTGANILPVDFPGFVTTKEGRFFCQCTQLLDCSQPLSFLDLRQYIQNVAIGTLTIGQQMRIITTHMAGKLLGIMPRKHRIHPEQTRSNLGTPLGLKTGEWVKVKEFDEIAKSLDSTGRSNGLRFMGEMKQYCGQKFQVEAPIQRLINESDGKMVHLKNTVGLRNVFCDGSCHRGCPRQSVLLWRESWLQRAEPGSLTAPDHQPK